MNPRKSSNSSTAISQRTHRESLHVAINKKTRCESLHIAMSKKTHCESSFLREVIHEVNKHMFINSFIPAMQMT